MTDVLGESNNRSDVSEQVHPRRSGKQFSETKTGGLHRRALLAAGATATVLAATRSFAQNQPPVAPAPMGEAAMPSNVRVERLDGSILTIGIRQDNDRVELSSVIGLGHLMYMLDHDPGLRVAVLYSQGPDFSVASSMPKAGHRSCVLAASRKLPSSSIRLAPSRRVEKSHSLSPCRASARAQATSFFSPPTSELPQAIPYLRSQKSLAATSRPVARRSLLSAKRVGRMQCATC